MHLKAAVILGKLRWGGAGGSAGSLECIIVNPASSYAYVIGAAGSGGGVGVAGKGGIIIVEAY